MTACRRFTAIQWNAVYADEVCVRSYRCAHSCRLMSSSFRWVDGVQNIFPSLSVFSHSSCFVDVHLCPVSYVLHPSSARPSSWSFSGYATVYDGCFQNDGTSDFYVLEVVFLILSTPIPILLCDDLSRTPVTVFCSTKARKPHFYLLRLVWLFTLHFYV